MTGTLLLEPSQLSPREHLSQKLELGMGARTAADMNVGTLTNILELGGLPARWHTLLVMCVFVECQVVE